MYKTFEVGINPTEGLFSIDVSCKFIIFTKNVFYIKTAISNFFTFKDKIPSFLRSGIVYRFQCGSCNATYYGKTKRYFNVLALFTNFSVVAAMLPIMAKLSVILRSECANTWEFLHSLGKELKVMMIPPLKNIFYSAITHLNLKIF